ncbi:PIN domain-containing protein [Bacillus subtilis]|uniref:PIN domain-containing protein n=1 Tax=Bacillus subtilis TaxID=1423 RepID=UPI00129EB8DA|nr:PIN domain-containing protein [Bacillus subtilis]MEC2217459.1 PIN domain-containing protein [Bacillus subtilis]QGI15748.1 hypothetical protein GII80_22030 [Bacillus subtilis]CAF1775668.1 hypothetical protein NRS6092_04140 [Bacillus subtilis]CAF1851417.1 hypothetical protein NRS6134_03979 [Bacillus subtilis]CAI6329559.1 DUF4935 domain-containing protein [Bacillus subtilis]
MNFFIDTNVLFSDPFLKNNEGKRLIDMVRMSLHMDRETIERTGYNSEFLHERSKIYISSVVYAETKNKYFEKIDELFSHLEKFDDGIKVFIESEEGVKPPYTKEQYQQQFDQYYDELQQEGIIEILHPYDDITKPLIDRAVNKKPPFFNGKKNEFRDFVIWSTYSSFVKENNLENCYFITNNVHDFFDPDCKDQLHPELLKEYDKFIVYKSFKELNIDKRVKGHYDMHTEIYYHLEKNKKKQATYDLLNKFKDYLDNEIALNLLKRTNNLDIVMNEVRNIISKAKSDLSSSHLNLLVDNNNFPVHESNIQNLKIKEKTIAKNSVFVSADITAINKLNVAVNGYENSITVYKVTSIVPISFFIDLDLKISNFECESAYIEEAIKPLDPPKFRLLRKV